MNNKSSQVIIVDSLSDPEKIKQWLFINYTTCDWIFLDDDYLKFLSWKEKFGNSFSYVSVSKELDLSAKNLKISYLGWIGELGIRNFGSAWWASRVSERNPMVSSLYLNVCRLDVIRKYFSVTRPITIVVVGNSALKYTFENMEWGNFDVIKTPRKISFQFKSNESVLRVILEYFGILFPLIILKRILGLLFIVCRARVACGIKCDSIASANPILIHTYLDETSFAKNGEFHDRYFPGLYEFYESKGYKVFVLPYVFERGKKFSDVWRKINRAKQKFINPYAFYKLSDYIQAFKVAFQALFLPTQPLNFQNIDITKLVNMETRRFAFDALHEILYTRLPLRLRERGINCLAVLSEFENMIPEKMIILGFRSYQPGCELIGVQHSVLFPNLICNFISKNEWAIAPMHDRIICNSYFFKDILCDVSIPAERLSVGAALRYSHLTDYLSFDVNSLINRPMNIFVPLPLMVSTAIELLHKIVIAFGSKTQLRVILKAHPMSSIQKLMEKIPGLVLPANFEISFQSTEEIIKKSRVVIGLGTTSLFEAAAAGVPVVRVYSEAGLNIDAMGYFSDLPPPAFSVEDIVCETERLLKLNQNQLQQLLGVYKKYFLNSFIASDEVGLTAYLPARNRYDIISNVDL